MSRFIDAEKLEQIMGAWLEENKENECAAGVQTALRMIRAMPTVEGTWEERYIDDAPIFLKRRWYCSECGDWNTNGETPFCPECGAKMRVKE